MSRRYWVRDPSLPAGGYWVRVERGITLETLRALHAVALALAAWAAREAPE